MMRALVPAVTAAALLMHGGLAHAGLNLGPFFPPKGEVRMRSIAASDPVTTTASFNTGFVPIPGFGVIPITIPRGFVADVEILFSGEMNSADAQYVSAVVDGTPTPPGIVQAFWGVHGGATSQSANFTAFLTEGNHTLEMQWGGLGGQQFMSARSLTLILSVHHTSGHPAAG